MKIHCALAALALATVTFARPQTNDISSYKARELRDSKVWINGGPFTLKSLKGKVVVLDFWAFDCEPCIEAMPRVNELYREYAPDGLVVVGVHTPRADYERNVAKLREAVQKLAIQFPVVVDDNRRCFATIFVISGLRNS